MSSTVRRRRRRSGILQIDLWTARRACGQPRRRAPPVHAGTCATRRHQNGDSPQRNGDSPCTDAETRRARGPSAGGGQRGQGGLVRTRTPKGRARSSRSNVGWWMSRIGPVARPHAEPRHGAGHVLQVPGEVLAAAGLLGARRRGVRPDRRRRRRRPASPRSRPRSPPAARRGVCRGCTRRRWARGSPPTSARTFSSSSTPRGVVGGAQRAAQHAVLRDRVGRLARLHRAPDQHGARARVDLPREQQRQLGDQQPERLDEVGGQVRPRRVPARRGEPDLQHVARRRDRPDPGAEPADLAAAGRSAARRSARRPPSRRRRPCRSRRRAGSPRRAGRSAAPGRAASGAAASARPAPSSMAVCASCPQACMTPVDGRGEREAGVLVQRQGVEVGAQRDAALAEPDVADEAGAAGQGARLEPGRHQRAARRTPWCGARRGRAPVRRAASAARPTTLARVRGEPRVEPGRPAAHAEIGRPRARARGRGARSSTVTGHPLLRGPAIRSRSSSCISPILLTRTAVYQAGIALVRRIRAEGLSDLLRAGPRATDKRSADLRRTG